MKIAILNDTHFGYKNSSRHFMEYQKRFLEETFFPYCIENNITQIIHLGDLFDNRKHITIKTLNFVQNVFLKRLREHKMKMDIVPGNHDTAYKNTNELCSLTEVLPHYSDCVTVYSDPTILDYDDLKIGLVPWIAADNYEQCIKFIQNAQCSILAGHLEISGFKYIANSNIKSHGFKKDMFEKYDHVFSGHYHTKSTKDNITYLGSHFQFNWGDVDDKKHFHVFDTETRDLISIENKDKIYVKLYYNDENLKDIDSLLKYNKVKTKPFENKYVRVIVQRKTDFHLFDTFVDYINKKEPFDLNIIENYDIIDGTDTDDESIVEDTSTLIDNYVDNVLETDLDKNKVKQILQELYTEASVYDSL